MNVPRVFDRLDLDRTLLDTTQLVALFENYLAIHHPELARLVRVARQEIEQSGGSYNILHGVRQHVADGGDQLVQDFSVSVRENKHLLLPYAKELIDAIIASGQPWGIMTYGGRQWQMIKLDLSGLGHVPVIIIPGKGKGKRIAGWQDSDGQYRLPETYGGSIVDTVVLVDDKPVEFDGLPIDTARGYLLRPNHATVTLPSQQGQAASNVRTISSLRDVIDLEQLIASS